MGSKSNRNLCIVVIMLGFRNLESFANLMILSLSFDEFIFLRIEDWVDQYHLVTYVQLKIVDENILGLLFLGLFRQIEDRVELWNPFITYISMVLFACFLIKFTNYITYYDCLIFCVCLW